MRWVLVGRRLRQATDFSALLRPQDVYLGLGLYETVGCQDGLPLLWEAHRARLLLSAQELFGEQPALPGEREVQRLLEASGRARGPAALRVVWFPRRAAVAWASRYRVPRRLREEGCRLTTAVLPANPLTGHKTTSVAPAQVFHRRALASGYDGVVFLDADGCLRETATANLFVVFRAEIVTPPAPQRALPGVIRSWCLQSLAQAGWAVREGDVTLPQLLAADGAFCTSSLAGLVPVRAVDGVPLPFPGTLRQFMRGQGLPVPG